MDEPCCAVLKQIMETYDGPFERPICFDKDMNLYTGPVAIRLFHRTKAGAMQRQDQPLLRLNYCPFCGKAFSTQEE